MKYPSLHSKLTINFKLDEKIKIPTYIICQKLKEKIYHKFSLLPKQFLSSYIVFSLFFFLIITWPKLKLKYGVFNWFFSFHTIEIPLSLFFFEKLLVMCFFKALKKKNSKLNPSFLFFKSSKKNFILKITKNPGFLICQFTGERKLIPSKTHKYSFFKKTQTFSRIISQSSNWFSINPSLIWSRLWESCCWM